MQCFFYFHRGLKFSFPFLTHFPKQLSSLTEIKPEHAAPVCTQNTQ